MMGDAAVIFLMAIKSTKTRFDDHISRCSACAIYLGQIRQTIALTGRLTVDELSPEAERELLDAFRGWRSGA